MGLVFALVHTEMVIPSRSEQPLKKSRGLSKNFKCRRFSMFAKKLTFLSVLLLCATWVVAQSTPAGGARPAGNSGPAGQPQTPGAATQQNSAPPTSTPVAPPTGSVNP